MAMPINEEAPFVRGEIRISLGDPDSYLDTIRFVLGNISALTDASLNMHDDNSPGLELLQEKVLKMQRIIDNLVLVLGLDSRNPDPTARRNELPSILKEVFYDLGLETSVDLATYPISVVITGTHQPWTLEQINHLLTPLMDGQVVAPTKDKGVVVFFKANIKHDPLGTGPKTSLL